MLFRHHLCVSVNVKIIYIDLLIVVFCKKKIYIYIWGSLFCCVTCAIGLFWGCLKSLHSVIPVVPCCCKWYCQKYCVQWFASIRMTLWYLVFQLCTLSQCKARSYSIVQRSFDPVRACLLLIESWFTSIRMHEKRTVSFLPCVSCSTVSYLWVW